MRRFLVVLGLLLAVAGPRSATLSTCTEESLRTAIGQGGLIELRCASELIRLTSPLVITTNTILLATNSAMVISGNNETRLFVVRPGVELTISNIALFSGRHTETNFNDGGIPDTAGAAIYNDGGTVRLLRSTVSSHTVIGTAGRTGGGGLQGEDGEDGGDAAGAAIFNRGGLVVVSNIVFSSNRATGGQGGVGGNGFGGLGGQAGDGGNGGSAGGAAIYSQGGTVQIYNSTFTNNTVVGASAGIGGVGSGLLGFHGEPGGAGEAVGGAVAGDANSTLLIYGSTFIANTAEGADGNNGSNGLRNLKGSPGRSGGGAAGGAVHAAGSLQITNSTFTANSAAAGQGGNGGTGGPTGFGADGGSGGDGGTARGGAVSSTQSGTIINATFAANTVTAGAPGTGGAGSGVGRAGRPGQPGGAQGGSIANSGGELEIANTILADSTPANSDGPVTDLGGNLSTDGTPLWTNSASLNSTDIVLSSLAANGGPAPTMALSTNSPAVNAGLAQFCPPVDQRGSNRWQQCDIGAFEFNGGVLATPTNIALVVASAPVVTNGASHLAISWPASAHNLRLVMNTNLATTNWSAVAREPSASGSNRTVLVPLSQAPHTFFRLAEVPAPAAPPGPPVP